MGLDIPARAAPRSIFCNHFPVSGRLGYVLTLNSDGGVLSVGYAELIDDAHMFVPRENQTETRGCRGSANVITPHL